jgi:hypothetical protein
LFGFVILTNGASVIDDVKGLSGQQLGYIVEQLSKAQRVVLTELASR